MNREAEIQKLILARVHCETQILHYEEMGSGQFEAVANELEVIEGLIRQLQVSHQE
jgi:hypothetical protein